MKYDVPTIIKFLLYFGQIIIIGFKEIRTQENKMNPVEKFVAKFCIFLENFLCEITEGLPNDLIKYNLFIYLLVWCEKMTRVLHFWTILENSMQMVPFTLFGHV